MRGEPPIALSPARRTASPTPKRRTSSRSTAGAAPARLGVNDGFGTGADGTWVSGKMSKAPPKLMSGGKSSANVNQIAQLLMASLAYTLAGPLLIKLNNQILHHHSFPYPIALSALGVGFAALMSHLLLRLGIIEFTQPALRLSWSFYLRSALPIAALSALTLALGNASYVYLSVAMCQMLKALTPALTLGLLSALNIDRPTTREAACVVVITLGSIFTTRGEIAASQTGLALQLGANLAEATRLVLSQQLLTNRKLPLMEMQYHVAPLQLLCLLAASAVFELRAASDRAAAHAALATAPFPFLGAGVLGLLLQVVGLLTVKVAGSVTVKLLGIARGAGLVLFEVVYSNGNSLAPSTSQLAGYTASVCGFVGYTLVRVGGMNNSPGNTKSKTS